MFSRRILRGVAGLVGALVLVQAPGAALASDLALMPWPKSISEAGGAQKLDGEMTIAWSGHRDGALERAAGRFLSDIHQRTGLTGPGGPQLEIVVAGADPAALTPQASEAYRLTVADGVVRIEAQGPIGALRGLATLRQLVRSRGDGFELPYTVIEDAPRFPWRGLMIDTARHFVRLETLKRQIDAMERTKLNVLHLHLSDSEGFRVESRRFPKLVEVGSHGEYYTQAEIRELVAYAADRGVRIVPEFGVPGHAGAILSAYPELSASPVNPADRIGLMGLVMDPTRAETYAFLEELFAEMAGLFPDPYFHIGGDEAPIEVWTGNPAIAAYMAEHGVSDGHALQARFFERVHAIVRGLGKTAIGWEEVAARPLNDAVVVQAWRSSQALTHITAQNNRAIVSAGYYLDLLWPGLDHYARDPLDPLATPPQRPGDVLGPAPHAALQAAEAQLVLGAEASLWSEVVTDEMVDGRLWPRAALLAERFWSPATVRDPVAASRRLVIVQEGLRQGGVLDAEVRRRMVARLAPEDAETVERLASATGPVRNFARLWEVIAAVRNGQRPKAPRLNTLADAAGPDSLETHRLAVAVDMFLAGDKVVAPALRAQLAIYRDNHVRFERAAQGRAGLEAALPISADLAALAATGLEAMAMIEDRRRPSPEWIVSAQAILKRQADAEAASASNPIVWSGAKQPPANLLIIATPSIARLVEASVR